jgi:outer membrane protein TolC
MSVRFTRFDLRELLRPALCAALLATGSLMVQANDASPASAAALKLTLGQAVQMGLEKQPAIAAARASLTSSAIQRDAAWSTMSIISGPIVNVRRQQADLGVSIAHAGVEDAELSTTHAVSRVYLSALYAEEQIKVAQEAVTNLKVVHDAAKTLVNAGSKNVFSDDVDRIATYMLLAEAKLGEARLGHARALAALREAIGVGSDCTVEFVGEPLSKYHDSASKHIAAHGGSVNCRCAVEVALKHRPEVAMATMLCDVAHLEIKAQGMSFHPYSRTFAATSDLHSKVLPATVINGDYRPGALAPEMPVYLAGSSQSRQCRATALAERSVAVVDKTRGLIALETEEACVRLHEAGNQIALLSKAVAQSIKIADDARRGYRNDQMGTDRMLTAQVVEAQNKASLNEALFKYATALATLQRATAGHLWDCLEKPVAPAISPAPAEKLEKAPAPKTGN